MAATGWLIRRHVRRRWAALGTLGLIVALGGTGTVVAAGAADRTAGAYGEYLDRADVGDVVINPSLDSTEIDRVIRGLPGVRSVTTDSLLLASFGDGTPRTVAELDSDPEAAQVRASADGRFTAMDRPVLEEGRMPTGRREVVVNPELAEAEGLAVGDVVSVELWWRRDDLLAAPTDVISPIAVEPVTVVGIATLADEVLPDDLYPRARAILSPDIATRYECLPDQPARDATLMEASVQVTPEGCASSYRYYSLELEDGAAGVPAALDAFQRQSDELAATLPAALQERQIGYFLIATTTADDKERVERSLQPAVTALAVLGAVVGAVTVVLAGLAVARELRRSEDDQLQWWRLGLTAPERLVVVAVPLVGAVVVGLAVALGVGWALSPVGPVGSVRSIEPTPARELSAWAWVAGLALAGGAAAAATALAAVAVRRTGRPAVRRREVSAVGRIVRGWGRPEADEGVRAAFARRGAGLVVASCAVAAGVFLAAAVFGASLSAVLSTPASYGWPWDIAVMGGFGYGGQDVEALTETLNERGDVESWTALGLTNDLSADGRPVLGVMGWEQRPGIDFAVVDGRLPRSADEVALGSRTARDLDVGVGDTFELSGDGVEPHRVTVTGLAVLPPLGQGQAARLTPGTGMVVPAAMFEPDHAASLVTFVGIDLAPGADTEAALADLHDDFVAWDINGYAPLEYGDPVRPAEIVNVQSMRAVPLVVGGLLAGTALVGLLVAVVVSVRGRRRELAILRALGFTGRQVRNSVRVQATAAMAAALIVGVPLGIAAGRLAWRAFALRLGVVVEPSTPAWWVVGTVVGALVLALAAAAVPARVAARIRPAVVLRAE